MAEESDSERSQAVEGQPRDVYGRWKAGAAASSKALGDVISAGDEGGLWKNPADRMKLVSNKMKLNHFATMGEVPIGRGGFGVSDKFQNELDSEWDMHKQIDEAVKNSDSGDGFFGIGADKKKQAAAKKLKAAKKVFDTTYSAYEEDVPGY